MKPLAELHAVAVRNGIDDSVTDVMAQIAALLESGFEDLENHLVHSVSEAPDPAGSIIAHILNAGGKRIRPALCMLSARAVNPQASLPTELATVCELLHSATLLHDDVIDDGDTRRGVPAARRVWTNALSILGGDYALMCCVETMAGFDRRFLQLFVETLRELVEGEIVQLRLRNSTAASESDYFAIVNGKTSSLFCFSAASGAMSAAASATVCEALGAYGRHVGTAFQLIDDVLDFTSDADVLGKDLMSDIAQGKMTLPIIVAASRSSEMNELLQQLTRMKDAKQAVQRIAGQVAATGALEAVRARAALFTQEAIDALQKIAPENPRVVALMTDLARALLSRSR